MYNKEVKQAAEPKTKHFISTPPSQSTLLWQDSVLQICPLDDHNYEKKMEKKMYLRVHRHYPRSWSIDFSPRVHISRVFVLLDGSMKRMNRHFLILWSSIVCRSTLLHHQRRVGFVQLKSYIPISPATKNQKRIWIRNVIQRSKNLPVESIDDVHPYQGDTWANSSGMRFWCLFPMHIVRFPRSEIPKQSMDQINPFVFPFR